MVNMNIRMLIPAVLAMFLLSGCADIKKLEDLEVNSIRLENVTPHGLRSLGVTLVVEIDNPGAEVSLSEISGQLEHSGKVLGKVAVDPFTLQGKKTDVYHLQADLSLGEGATVLDLGRLLEKKVMDEALVDVSAKVRIRKGPARKMGINDMPLKKLIDAVK